MDFLPHFGVAHVTNMEMRLQKWVSQQGIASRREAEKWITLGRFSVNGKPFLELGHKVDPEKDTILLDGELLRTERANLFYGMLNKPDCVLTTRKDPVGRPTVFSLPVFKDFPDVFFPVGRLDFRTEGLLLFSNDGEWVHRLTHPKFKVPRMYEAWTERRLSDDVLKYIRQGVELEDGPVNGIFIEPVKTKNRRGFCYSVKVCGVR
jgi:23S rRNA pseudouridine2605 synthase